MRMERMERGEEGRERKEGSKKFIGRMHEEGGCLQTAKLGRHTLSCDKDKQLSIRSALFVSLHDSLPRWLAQKPFQLCLVILRTCLVFSSLSLRSLSSNIP